jgi:magnesium-transporting ATPase (P-type)
VPADIQLEEGSLLVDQSALTGESAAVTVEPGKTTYAGGMVRATPIAGTRAPSLWPRWLWPSVSWFFRWAYS